MQLSKLNDTVSLPFSGKSVAASDYAQEKVKTVLLIDDEEMVIDICERMLEKLGHKVFKAHSGPEGLKIFEQNKSRIDLVISDLNMPEMDGQKVAAELQKIDHGVKVLLSSGCAVDSDENQAVYRGFNGFLKKPYNMSTLAEKMAEILN